MNRWRFAFLIVACVGIGVSVVGISFEAGVAWRDARLLDSEARTIELDDRVVWLEDAVRLQDAARVELHERLHACDRELAVARAVSSEYAARQCMVTVARGDYDDFLRQLGWSRGGR